MNCLLASGVHANGSGGCDGAQVFLFRQPADGEGWRRHAEVWSPPNMCVNLEGQIIVPPNGNHVREGP